jgi:hypothetical protein
MSECLSSVELWDVITVEVKAVDGISFAVE